MKSKRNKKLKKINYSLIKKIIIFTLILSVIYLATSLVPKTLIIRSYSCSSQFGPCHESIMKFIEDFGSDSYLKSKESLKKFLDENILVREYSIQYEFPDKLQINIIENKAIFGFSFFDGEGLTYLVDDRGLVIGSERNSNLPRVKMEGGHYDIGSKVSEEILFALQVMNDVFRSYGIKEGVIEKDALLVNFTKGYTVIFPLRGDKEILMGSLSLIISRLNGEDEGTRIEEVGNVEIIDLRFKNPVIK